MADQANAPHAPDPATPVPDGSSSHDRAPAELIEGRLETVTVRRAPKIFVFLVLGAALGLLVAMILTFGFNQPDAVSPDTGLVYSLGQVFGFLVLVCVTVGVVLGAIVALVFERTIGRRTRQVVVDRESVTTRRLSRSAAAPQASSAMIGWIAASNATTSPRSPSVTAIVSEPIHQTPRCASGSTCTLSSNECARCPPAARARRSRWRTRGTRHRSGGPRHRFA